MKLGRAGTLLADPARSDYVIDSPPVAPASRSPAGGASWSALVRSRRSPSAAEPGARA
jgi:hypothetical protein